MFCVLLVLLGSKEDENYSKVGLRSSTKARFGSDPWLLFGTSYLALTLQRDRACEEVVEDPFAQRKATRTLLLDW